MKIFIAAALLIAILGNKCKQEEKPLKDKIEEVYDIKWWHSYEEDSAGFKFYRPDTFQFPPSRGREGFILQKDNQLVWLGIAATDGTEKIKGSWVLGPSSELQFNFKEGERKLLFDVISIGKDKIILNPKDK
jgi:hypothetical protein